MSVTSWFRSHLDLRALILPYHPEILALANQLGSVKNAYEYVRDQIKYVRDKGEVWRFPADVEICDQNNNCKLWIGTIRLGGADCDDKSLLLASLIRALGDTAFVRVVEIPAGGHAYVMWHGRVLDATSTVPFERDIRFKNEHLIADFNDYFVEVYDEQLFNRVIVALFLEP